MCVSLAGVEPATSSLVKKVLYPLSYRDTQMELKSLWFSYFYVKKICGNRKGVNILFSSQGVSS